MRSYAKPCVLFLAIMLVVTGCDTKTDVDDLSPAARIESSQSPDSEILKNPDLDYQPYESSSTDLVISRADYLNRLQGFWLGQCIGNWTGLVTEMDKIGGSGIHGKFYTRDDWGRPDQPAIWGNGQPSDLSETIGFVFEQPGGVWGADDDTDIEYMYQHLLLMHQTSVMYSLASSVDQDLSTKDRINWMAQTARQRLPNDSYSAKMYDFVKAQYEAGVPWEQTRDELYKRYQVQQRDGYDISSRNLYANGGFASGINFGASIVSLLYGEGDFKETIKIAVLAGWDSDNPAATWGGLLGFMLGSDGIENAFDQKFADQFNIHRTRGNFPNNGIDTFPKMAEHGVMIVDRVVQEEMEGGVDLEHNQWYIPDARIQKTPGIK